MFDGVVRSLSNVKHVPKLKKSLIFLRALGNLGFVFFFFFFFAKNNIMKIKGALIAMKRKRVKNLFTLIEKTILGGAMKVELPHEKFFTNIKEIVKAEERDKMITTRFLAKITH